MTLARSFYIKGGLGIKRLNTFLIIGLFIFSLTSCTSKQTLNPKVEGAITSSSRDLVGQTPISFDAKGRKIKWPKEELQEFQKDTNKWLSTLTAKYELNEMPLENYFVLSFQYPGNDNKMLFYIPVKADNKSYKNIYLKGYDNSEVKYYLLMGGKKETLAIINWWKENR